MSTSTQYVIALVVVLGLSVGALLVPGFDKETLMLLVIPVVSVLLGLLQRESAHQAERYQETVDGQLSALVKTTERAAHAEGVIAGAIASPIPGGRATDLPPKKPK